MSLTLKLAVAVVLICVVCSEVDVDRDRRTSDLVTYTLNQGHCKEVTERATRDCRWKAGLYPFVDWLVKKGRIVAYQIQWFNGHWSGWFVPGVNDIDIKFNPYGQSCALPLLPKSMRRWWSYFYDHNHKYIICTN